jgi:hypothetical protein
VNPRQPHTSSVMRIVVSLAVLLLGCSVTDSQNSPKSAVPTTAQYQADAQAWNREEDTGPKDKDVGYQLTYRELVRRQAEILDCMTSVDGQLNARGEPARVRNSYYHLAYIYTAAESIRYQHFVDRHHLFEQFLSEDSKGAR